MAGYSEEDLDQISGKIIELAIAANRELGLRLPIDCDVKLLRNGIDRVVKNV